MKLLIKLLVAAAVLTGFFYLFLRTAHDARATPYTVAGEHMQNWTLALDADGSRALLVVRPPQQFAGELFSQIFSRMMESLRGSTTAGIPLVLRDEYELSLARHFTPEGLLEAAQAGNLNAGAFEPRCVAVRRVSTPGVTRQMYYVLFDSPAFERFRQELARGIDASGAAAPFDPGSLSPVLIVASTDGTFDEWLPIGTDAAGDCAAPVVVD